MTKNIFSSILHKEKNIYVAECPDEEAIENLKEATELYLKEFPLLEKISTE